MRLPSRLATPDNMVWSAGPGIAGAVIDGDRILVRWVDGRSSLFHPMWLRDNCPCPQCTHPVTREQLIDLLDIPDDIAPVRVGVGSSAGLEVTWNRNDHLSVFNPDWLYAHSGLVETRPVKQVLWTSRELSEPPTFDGPLACRDDHTMHQVLTAVAEYGIARLTGLPTEENTVERFAQQIGPIRETHFERIFNVISRPDADSNAYTHAELPAHADIPTRETPPGLQLLHCLVAEAEGGESVMVDGFRVAEDIRAQYPEAFINLSTVRWTYANRAGETDYRWDTPHFVVDDEGRLLEVRLASFSRAPLVANSETVEASYRALRLFLRITYEARYRMVFPFAAGDLVIFDNRRILHARKAFDPSTGARHLQGAYVDRDDLLSTLRMIEQRNLRSQLETAKS